jgi:hypothetical protein
MRSKVMAKVFVGKLSHAVSRYGLALELGKTEDWVGQIH